MDPKDKYTVFTPHARGYRKGIHKVPKFTRVRRLSTRSFQALVDTQCCPQITHRVNPKGF